MLNSKILVISDLHIPHSLDWGIKLLFRFIKVYNPTRVIINGDLMDFYKISKFIKHPEYGEELRDEVKQAKEFLTKLREISRAQIDFIEGNHDMRLRIFLIKEAPDLAGFPELDIYNLLNMKKLKINFYPVKQYATTFVDNWLDVDGIHIGHFNKVNQGSGMTVRNLMNKRKGSFVQAHVHRAALLWRKNLDGTMDFGIENPCLYDSDKAPYVSDTDWQSGWSIITYGQPELIILNPEDKSFVWGGEKWK